MIRNILVLCIGNVCRSPMAEALFRHAVRGRDDYRVLSAGVGAVDGQPPSLLAIRALREKGLEVKGDREPHVIARHPAAVVAHPYQVLPALLHLDPNIG